MNLGLDQSLHYLSGQSHRTNANFDFQPVILQLAKHTILKIKLILIHVLAIKEYKPFHVVLFFIFGRYFGTKICHDNKYYHKLLIGPDVYKLKK